MDQTRYSLLSALWSFLFPVLSIARKLKRITGVIRSGGARATKSLSAFSAHWSFLFPILSIASMLRRITGVIR